MARPTPNQPSIYDLLVRMDALEAKLLAEQDRHVKLEKEHASLKQRLAKLQDHLAAARKKSS